MTQEQYNRAVEINQRINNLNKLKDNLESGRCKLGCLSFTLTENSISPFQRDVTDSTPIELSDIFYRHDKMIRDEIDAEIEKLKKEIEEL